MVRAVRAVRLLLALLVLPGMEELINAALLSIPRVGSAAYIAACVYLIAAIWGVQFFKGVLHYRCATAGIEELTYGHARALKGSSALIAAGVQNPQAAYDTGVFCYNDASVCQADTSCFYFEENPAADTTSFDSVLESFFPLSTTIVLDSWSQPMYTLMAAYSPWAWAFFAPLAAFGGFLILQLFLAVISETFISLEEARKEKLAMEEAEERKKRRGQRKQRMGRNALGLANEAEGSTVTSARAMFLVNRFAGKMLRSSARWRLRQADEDSDDDDDEMELDWLGKLVTSEKFANVMLGAVMVNIVIMCLPYHHQPESYAELLSTCNTVLTWMFIIEMGLKLQGLGCRRYWSNRWNALDGSIVLVSIFDVLVELQQALLGGGGMADWSSTLRVFRMLRIVRALRLIRKWKGMYSVICAFSEAIPQVTNLILLMTVIIYIFAVLGMSIFGATGLSELSREHFDSFPAAMITVLNLFIGGYVHVYQSCVTSVGAGLTAAYFVPAMIIGYLTLLNLFVGILLQTFSSSQQSKEDPDGKEGDRDDDSDDDEIELSGDNLIGVTCFCLKRDSDLRRRAAWLDEHVLSETVIVTLIMLSSVCLALDSPRLEMESDLKYALRVSNYCFTAIFSIECVLKIFAYGLRPYLTNPWNRLDLFIVLSSLLSLLASIFPALRGLQTLRILRVLRPLRLLTRDPRMKVVVETLAKTMPAVLNILMIVIALQIAFAIAGMRLFSGTFGSCSEPSITVRSECVSLSPPPLPASPLPPSPLDALALPPSLSPITQHRELRGRRKGPRTRGAGAPIDWENPPSGSFDDFGEAMLTLFIATTGDNYPDVLWSGMDSVGADVAPVRTDFSPTAIFFILWILVGTFMALNLFVGAIVENFHKLRAENEGLHLLTAEQKLWVVMMKESHSSKATRVALPPTQLGLVGRLSPARLPIYKMVKSQQFEVFMMVIILANVAQMALDHHGIEEKDFQYAIFMQGAIFFTYIYWVEFCVKMIGLGPRGYFCEPWCQFEFALLAASIVESMLSPSYVPPYLFRIVRLVRVLRIIRLLRHSRDVRDLLLTLAVSLPSLANVFSLLSLIIFIYAVLGMRLFTFVKLGEAYNAHVNFQTFGQACLLLFQVLTGDGWSAIMDDLRIKEDEGCNPNAQPTDCGTWLAMPFFVSFVVISNFVCLNLIVAVVLENFSLLREQKMETRRRAKQKLPQLPSADHIDEFKELWCKFDPSADGFMHEDKLIVMLTQLPRPLGVLGVESGSDPDAANDAILKRRAIERCKTLKGVREHEGRRVKFEEVLDALVIRTFEDAADETGSIEQVADLLPDESETRQELTTNLPRRSPTSGRPLITPRTLQFQNSIQRFDLEGMSTASGRPSLSAVQEEGPKTSSTPTKRLRSPSIREWFGLGRSSTKNLL